jgi:hypothetical protein
MKRILATVASICLLCAALCGCQSTGNADPTGTTYNMSHGLDAHQYCLFVNRHINVVANQLISQAMLASRYNTSSDTQSFITSVENSLQVIIDSRHEVEIMAPPTQYAENRINTLRLMDDAKDDISALLEELKKTNIDEGKVNALASEMQTDFIALLAEFDVYYK